MYSSRISIFSLLVLTTFGSACTHTIQTELAVMPEVRVPGASELKVSHHFVSSKAATLGTPLQVSGASYERVAKILNRVTTGLGVPAGLWPHYVIDAGSHANAAAINQNSIIVYQELLNHLEEDESLALVLAHEVAHLLLEHGSADAAVSLDAYRTDFEKGVAHNVETQADQLGVILFAAAGYDPQHAPALLERALSRFFEGGTGSTHPEVKERLQAVELMLPLASEIYHAQVAEQF